MLQEAIKNEMRKQSSELIFKEEEVSGMFEFKPTPAPNQSSKINALVGLSSNENDLEKKTPT